MALAPSQVREAMIRLGMTLDEFATFCGGGNGRSARHWMDGDRRINGGAEILIRLALGFDLRHPDKDMRDRIMLVAEQVRVRKAKRKVARKAKEHGAKDD
jgi:hypothetical protein